MPFPFARVEPRTAEIPACFFVSSEAITAHALVAIKKGSRRRSRKEIETEKFVKAQIPCAPRQCCKQNSWQRRLDQPKISVKSDYRIQIGLVYKMHTDRLIDPTNINEDKSVFSQINESVNEDVLCKLSPQEALGVLKDGNCKYRKRRSTLDVGAWDPEENAPQQSPIAVIVCCSDSRVPPELVFWQGLGRLFVTRVAGNTVDAAALGSIAYAVTTFKTPLVVVLGHEKCGAVEAAVKVVKNNKKYSDVIMDGIVKPIIPAVEEALKHHKSCGDLCEESMRESVRRTVNSLSKKLSDFLQKEKGPDQLCITGARYDVNDGGVVFFGSAPVVGGVGR